jgi:hypothetical protein
LRDLRAQLDSTLAALDADDADALLAVFGHGHAAKQHHTTAIGRDV